MVQNPQTKVDLDIRAFRRYARDLDCIVSIGKKSFKAKTLDYSFNGISILTDASIPLRPGDIIGLTVDGLKLRQKGRVQWIQAIHSRLRAGILKTGPFNGSFNDYEPSDIFLGLQKTLKTGILDVRKENVIKNVHIRNGSIIFAESNQDEDRLGDILLQSGKITRDQYAEVSRLKEQTGKRYAVILTGAGFLQPAELVTAVELQAKQIIESIFSLKDADFEFRETPFSLKDAPALRLPVADLIFGETKRNADIGLLEKHLMNHIMDFSTNPLNLFQRVDLDPADRTVVSLVDGKTRMEDIVRLSSEPRAETLKTIYALLKVRILVTKQEDESPHGISIADVFDRTQDPPQEFIEKIHAMHAQYSSLGYYGVLGLKKDASDDEIKKAFYQAAKEYHPDRNFSLPEDMKKKLLEVFTYITNAYITLRDPEKRKEHDDGIPPLHSETRTVQNREIAQSKFFEGKILFRKKKFGEAAGLFASAVYFDRSVAVYHYYHGCSLEKAGNLKEAVTALNKALELKPSDPDIMAELGHVYLKLGFKLRAKGYFTSSLKANPSHKRALEGIGISRKE